MAENVKDQSGWLPEPTPVIRANGDSVVELRQDGTLVGELNFTQIMVNVLGRFGLEVKRAPHLRSV